MAKEDIKPEIDAALDDLGFDLLEQNIPGFDQEAVLWWEPAVSDILITSLFCTMLTFL